MTDWFRGKVALVTGAGQGIGREAARLFASHGAKVVVVDLLRDEGEQTVELIRAAGGQGLFLETDVADGQSVAAMVGSAVKHFGGLHCAFNNAGICDPQDTQWSDSIFHRTINVNLTGIYHCIKFEAEHMKAAGGGAIVNAASILGIVASEQVGYVASKHAVIGLTKAAALTHARANIRINSVCPGVIMTRMTQNVIDAAGPDMRTTMESLVPMGRLGRPEELAECAVWLCSDKASYVTGQTLIADGGFTLR